MLVTGYGSAELQDVLVTALNARGLDASALPGASPEAAAAAAADADAVLVLTRSSGFRTPSSQVAVVEAVAATGATVIHAALRNPYDVVHVGEVAASLATYSTVDCSLEALAGAISGDVTLRGTLPVAIPTADGSGEAYPLGHGLR